MEHRSSDRTSFDHCEELVRCSFEMLDLEAALCAFQNERANAYLVLLQEAISELPEPKRTEFANCLRDESRLFRADHPLVQKAMKHLASAKAICDNK